MIRRSFRVSWLFSLSYLVYMNSNWYLYSYDRLFARSRLEQLFVIEPYDEEKNYMMISEDCTVIWKFNKYYFTNGYKLRPIGPFYFYGSYPVVNEFPDATTSKLIEELYDELENKN